jgi:hypothetical protein
MTKRRERPSAPSGFAKLSTEDEIRKNKSDCPLWNSFAAAREDGVRTTEAFLEALRAQTIFH